MAALHRQCVLVTMRIETRELFASFAGFEDDSTIDILSTLVESIIVSFLRTSTYTSIYMCGQTLDATENISALLCYHAH